MEGATNKSNLSTITTTGTPTTATTPHSDTVDHIKFMNPNFIENSDSSDHFGDFHKGCPNDVEPRKITSVPNKILPNNLEVVLSKTQKKTKDKLPEKTLAEMGYVANEVDGWEKIVQPTKKNLYSMLKDMIINHIKPNIQIRVGGVSFNCHMMVLQCYSEFFIECNNEVFIQLPEEKITPGAFMMVYDWMLADQPLVQREGILELFTAATFLRIPELVNQCWLCMDDDERFREDTAFLLYLEARKYNLESLEQLMLMRICRFFLTLVASKEFLTLSLKEICALLSSNTIGVNSEIEIFMSMIRWMSYDWEERSKHLMEVIKCVRFSLMPPWFLVSLTKHSENEEIDRIIANPEIRKLINDGISFTTTQLYYGDNREEFVHFLERYNLVVPMQRQWVFDKACKYHHRLDCPNMQYITYESFLQYLEMVQTTGKDYWRSMEMAKSQRMKCCLLADTRKAIEPDFDSELVDHRDQSIQCESVCKRQQRHNRIKAPLPIRRLPQFSKSICDKRTQLKTIAQMEDNVINSAVLSQDDSYYAVQEESICIVTCTDNLQLLSHFSPLETNAQSKKTLHTSPIRRNHKLEQTINANDISESFSKYVVYEYYDGSCGDTNDLHNDINYGQNVYHKDHGEGDCQIIYNKRDTPLLSNDSYSAKARLLPQIRKNASSTKNKSKLDSRHDKLQSYSKPNNEDFHDCNSNRDGVRPRSASKAEDSYPVVTQVKSCLKNTHPSENKQVPRYNSDIVDNRSHCKRLTQLRNHIPEKRGKKYHRSSSNHVYFKDFNESDHNDIDARSGSDNDKGKSNYQTAKNRSHSVDSSNCFKHGVKNKSISREEDSRHDKLDSHSNLRDNEKHLYYSDMQQTEYNEVDDEIDIQIGDESKAFSKTKHRLANKLLDGDCINQDGKSKLALKELDYCQTSNAKEMNCSSKYNDNNVVGLKIEKPIRHKRKVRRSTKINNKDNVEVAESSKHCTKNKLVSKVNCSDRIDYQKNNDERTHLSDVSNNDASDPSDVEAKVGLIGHRSRSHYRANTDHIDKFDNSNCTKDAAKIKSISPIEHNTAPSVDESNYQRNNDKRKYVPGNREYDNREISIEDRSPSKSKKNQADNAEASNYSKSEKYRSLSTNRSNCHKHISSLKIDDNYLPTMVEKSIPITDDKHIPLSNSRDICNTEINDNNCSKASDKPKLDSECKHASDKHDTKNHLKSSRKCRSNFKSKERCQRKDNEAVLPTSTKAVKDTLEDSNKNTDCLLERNYKVQKYKIILFGGIDPYCAYCQNEKHPNDDASNYTNLRNMHIREEDNIGNQVLMYDVNNLEWKQISCLPLGSRHHHSAVLCNSLIYVIGGTRTALGCSKKSVFEKSVWCFNPRSLKWTLESNLPESRRDFAVIAVDDSIHRQINHAEHRLQHDVGFYIIGGEGTNNIPLSSMWFYNIRHKTWIKKPSLNVGRYGLAATLVNNEIWVAGGIINYENADANNKTCISRAYRKHVITDAIEVYSLSNNKNAAEKWTKSKLHLRGPRVFAKFCKTTNGGLYVIGGLGFNEKGIFTSLIDVDYLNFETKEWEHFGNLNWSRHGHDVGTLNDHCFVVVGGVSTMGKHALNTVEAFCTKTRTSTALPELPFPLSGGALITLHS